MRKKGRAESLASRDEIAKPRASRQHLRRGHGKPRVAIVQYDDRPREQIEHVRFLSKLNAIYAKRRNYRYFFHDHLAAELPPYWAKVALVLRYLEQGFDIVLWLDSDAVIHDFSRGVESLFAHGATFVYAPDCPKWGGVFNAGVFAATSAAEPMIREWLSRYRARDWRRKGGRWLSKGPWAGETYEQGAFVAFVMPKYSERLHCLDWKVLQSPFPLPESFTLHFAGGFLSNAMIYLSALTT